MELAELNQDWSVAEGLASITPDRAQPSVKQPIVIFPPPAPAVEQNGLNGLPGFAANMRHTVHQWWERSRQRRQLVSLDDRLLADVGISRATAYEESLKPFWRS